MATQWTEAELHFAATQRTAGVAFKVISRKLGRSPTAIQQKLEYEAAKRRKTGRRRLPAHRWSDADDIVAARAHLKDEIAEARREAATTPPYKPEMT
jgi:hypothetical protein